MIFFKNFFSKLTAKQLRKPEGILAGKVGNKMNETNSFIYNLTVATMQLKENETVLEIGFGNGKLFDKVFSAANNLNVCGIDFSPEMVKEATKFNLPASANRQLTLRLGSSYDIPFPDSSFDKVFCINVIYFWEQPEAHLKEIFRVLKPGGQFYTAIRAKENLVQMPFAKYGFNIYTEDEWIQILQANLFHFVQTATAEDEPVAEFAGQLYGMKSLCIIAEKEKQ